MPYFYKTFTCITLFLLSSCNFNQVMINPLDKEDYSISFDSVSSIPFKRKRLKVHLIFMNENDAEPKTKIYIKDYSLQDYTIYAGSALRSLEGEDHCKI